MAARTTFGRKQPPIAGPSRAVMSAEAEAFRATLGSDRSNDPDAFSVWLRAGRGRRMLVWFGGAVLLLPGVACFLLHAPAWVGVTFEIAGVFANGWLRRERRRQLKAITGWEAAEVLRG